jgi:2-C-methyl-D-erythritol 4-phosphate cytidylyltransferase
MPRYCAIVPAAGSGARFGAEMPKQYLSVCGRPLLYHALRTLLRHAQIDRVVVVLSSADSHWQGFDWEDPQGKLMVLRKGGATRADSVRAGLAALESQLLDSDWVLVHDAARACLAPEDLETLIAELAADPVGGLLAVPLADTLKHGDAAGRVDRTPPRDGLWQAQTPQMFRAGVLGQALAAHGAVTDESSAVEAVGMKPRLIAARYPNFKVTYAADLELARLILEAREREEFLHA